MEDKLLAREIARKMMANGVSGRMLFVTSPHASTPRNLPHYSAAKAGQTMVVKELAKALGPHGIRVNAIAPGAVPGGGFSELLYGRRNWPFTTTVLGKSRNER